MHRILLLEIRLPRARVFRREPYVIGTIITGATSGAVPILVHPVRGVKRGRPAIFNPPVVLVEAEDFDGHVSGELMLVDSDEDFRRFGERFGRIRDDLARMTKLGVLLRTVAGAPAAGALAIRQALKPAADVVEYWLRKQDDDLMGRFEIFLDDEDDYREGDVITLASTRCEIDIQVVVLEDEPEWLDVGE